MRAQRVSTTNDPEQRSGSDPRKYGAPLAPDNSRRPRKAQESINRRYPLAKSVLNKRSEQTQYRFERIE